MLFKQTNQAKKPRAPKSKLQLANGEAQWAMNFKLQHFHMSGLNNLFCSVETRRLVMQLNEVVDSLRASIQDDYDRQADVHRKKPLPKSKDKPIKQGTNPVFVWKSVHLTVGDELIRLTNILKVTKLKDNPVEYVIETKNSIYHVTFSNTALRNIWERDIAALN